MPLPVEPAQEFSSPVSGALLSTRPFVVKYDRGVVAAVKAHTEREAAMHAQTELDEFLDDPGARGIIEAARAAIADADDLLCAYAYVCLSGETYTPVPCTTPATIVFCTPEEWTIPGWVLEEQISRLNALENACGPRASLSPELIGA